MQTTTEKEERPTRRTRAKVKAVCLVVFIIAAVYVMRFTPAKDLVTLARMESILQAAGFWAPLLFMLIYALGVCLFVPGTVLGALGPFFSGPTGVLPMSGSGPWSAPAQPFSSGATWVGSLPPR